MRGVRDEGSKVEVLLETRVEDARGQLPPVGLSPEQTEGGTLLRCSTWSLGWMARVLAGLDCSFVVRRPAELRDALELRAEKIAILAKRTQREASSEKAPNSRARENSPADWRA